MITKDYIKMCEKNEDLQEQLILAWSFVIVKKCWATEKREIGIVTSLEEKYKRYNIFMKGNLYGTIEQNNLIYLPTQEQLQEMVSCNWHDVFCKFLWWHSDDDRSSKEFESTFTSMNEVWLAFVMKQKYHKTWTGEKWVKAE